jgi:hypothetical protein
MQAAEIYIHHVTDAISDVDSNFGASFFRLVFLAML